jgi:hypothetical protein
MGEEVGEEIITTESRDPRWIGGVVLFIVGILGICGSTLVGYMMMGSGMISASTGFVVLYYVITGVFVVVMGVGANLVYNSTKDAGRGAKMANGILFTIIGLIGASASTVVGYQMLGSGMMQSGYGFDILFYLLTVVFIGITLFGLYVVYMAVK